MVIWYNIFYKEVLSNKEINIREIFDLLNKISPQRALNKYLKIENIQKINGLLKPIFKLKNKKNTYNNYFLNYLNFEFKNQSSKENLDFKNQNFEKTLKETINYLKNKQEY